MKKIILIIAATALLTGCGNDASIEKRDTGSADVLNMPDKFPNVAHKCDGKGHRVYVSNNTSAGAGSVAVVEDPTCGGGQK